MLGYHESLSQKHSSSQARVQMSEFGVAIVNLKGEEKPVLQAGGSILGAQDAKAVGPSRQEARSTRCRSEPNCFKNQSYQGPNGSKNGTLNVAGSHKASRLFLTTIASVQRYTKQQSACIGTCALQSSNPCALSGQGRVVALVRDQGQS